jgi:hypothetical protein
VKRRPKFEAIERLQRAGSRSAHPARLADVGDEVNKPLTDDDVN